MFGFIKNRLLFKLILLFILIVFTPISVVTYFVYDLVVDNYNENVVTSLKTGENYVNTIFDRNLNLVSANRIKIKDDYQFRHLLASVVGGNLDVREFFNYLKMNYGYDFVCISKADGGQEKFYSELIKRTGDLDLSSETGTPVINYTSHNFIALVKTEEKFNGSTVFLTVGKIIDGNSFIEISKILNFDFTVFEKSDGKILNKFSTITDEYGFIIDPGRIMLDHPQTEDRIMIDGKISNRNRKILVFKLNHFRGCYSGAVSIVENLEYISTAKKHFTILILTFIGLTLILGIFIRNKLVSPISELLEGIGNVSHQIDSGQPIEALPTTGDDEIGRLADEFNKMSSSLGRSFSRIKYLQNYLLNIFESMPSAMIAVDNKGKITQWNKSAEKYKNTDSVLKQGEDIWKAISELGVYKDELLKVINDRGHIEIYREPFRDGEKVNLNIHLFPLIANGVKGSVIRIDDITELKKKEEQLRQSQKMETIGTLAGGIAHDFNNILSGIVGVVSILKYKIDKNLDITKDQLTDYLDIMEQSGRRAGDIVQRLLTLSRKQNTTMEKVDVSEVLNHVVKICSNTFDKSIKIKGININSKSSLCADFTQLEQVILNLAINANHAMTIMRPADEQPGGILTIEVSDFVPEPELAGFTVPEDEKDYFRISIIDTGVGMDSTVISQIFEPFFSTKDKSMGTGLGLTIVYNIIQQFGGFIDVDSTPGKGTEFKIYLPKYDREAETQHRQHSVQVMKGSGTVLVVDDEPVLRELARSMLMQAGYQVILAEDGDVGIEIYKNRSAEISLVLLDMMMPNRNGKETFAELIRINKDIKVIMTSGFTKDKRVEDVLSAGVSDFIQKPYTIFALSEKVHKVLFDETNDQ
jgi:PAS domain S-box-containing protein